MRMASFTTCALLAGSARAFRGGFVSTGLTSTSRSYRASRAMSMAIKEGDRLPMGAVFSKLVDGKPQDINAADLFTAKKVVICGVPGAMTPTCSETHLPGFVEALDAFKAKGIDTVACISVNDAYVMGAWAKKLNIAGQIEMLADGGAAFAKSIGHEFDTANFGGIRLKRMAMLVDDGVVQKLGVEEGGAFTDKSAAKTILDAL